MPCIKNMPGKSPFKNIKLSSKTEHQVPKPGLNGEDMEPMEREPPERNGKVIPCLERLFCTDEARFIGTANVVDAGTQFPGFLLRKNDSCLPQLRFKTL